MPFLPGTFAVSSVGMLRQSATHGAQEPLARDCRTRPERAADSSDTVPVFEGEVMDSYDENAFRARIDAALRRVRTVLDNTRNPQYPAEVPHRYDDKYLLAEFATRVAIASM